MCGAEANRAASGDRSQSQADFKLQSKNFFDLAYGQSPRWQADPPFRGEAACHCCPAVLRACGNHSGEAGRSSGIGLKLFGFIPEPVFTLIPESCSRSSRNAVRNHPRIAFTFPWIPHMSGEMFSENVGSPIFAFEFAVRARHQKLIVIAGAGNGICSPKNSLAHNRHLSM